MYWLFIFVNVYLLIFLLYIYLTWNTAPHDCPLSPIPCIKMSVALCCPEAGRTTGCSGSSFVDISFPMLHNNLSYASQQTWARFYLPVRQSRKRANDHSTNCVTRESPSTHLSCHNDPWRYAGLHVKPWRWDQRCPVSTTACWPFFLLDLYLYT